MNPRQQAILKAIVEHYIQTAQPVGSKFLAECGGFCVSPATIRNDMVALEEEGYVRAPHTSAGRVPTEQGYEFYLSNLKGMRKKAPNESFRQAVRSAGSQEEAVKQVAKKLVDLSGEMALVAFNPKWSYFTGVSNLFAKPDFCGLGLTQELSQMLDQFDEVIGSIFEHLPAAPQVMIGSENPFGDSMSSIVVKYQLPNQTQMVLGLVGPMRMDYQQNLKLIEEALESLD
ncbi:MAG: hypothetical protein ABIG32_03150, partial [Candidatus Uhrbacteria bacterium]